MREAVSVVMHHCACMLQLQACCFEWCHMLPVSHVLVTVVFPVCFGFPTAHYL